MSSGTAASGGGISDNLRGALFMMASMLAFLLNDTFMKALGAHLPLYQAIGMRGIATTVLLAAIGLATGGLRWDLSRGDRWRVVVRSIAEALSAIFYIGALFNLPLANATAILQALPLTVTLAGALFLREPVGWRRWSAILVGFMGVLLIVRPGPDGFNHFTLLALAAVATVTLRDLVTRKLDPKVPSMTVAVSSSLGATLFALAASTTTPWVPLNLTAAALMAGAALFVILGYMFSIMAMRVGDLAAVTPFRYTGLVFGLILGLVVFGDWPDGLTLLGAGIVVATGLFTLYRERAVKRPEGPVPLRIR
ncbi:DMT family transporter [Frigidibacter sp. ROC022]|uniref:DMT family transporter n=1 Tax=Frigidibacter sp. ROC022 TaxID=2971796 RepID=UPI00215A870D|nr:DMT family transporter [Frigidibacter sp. ROC022]MCR8726544.1 DMT family transporter [Frigidibacter sp. ROC022]